MCPPILETREVHYAYGNAVPALCGLDLRVDRGRRLALVGANGAGKSTLLLHLNGLLKPTRGQVYIDGRPIDYGRHGLVELRRRVGIVFQDPDDQLFSASVYQDISFGPMSLGLGEADVRARVEEALSTMGVSDLRDRATHMLSFGQKKRVAIAGVLAMRPDVLILDEPTAGLDPSGVTDLLSLLDALHASGTTLIAATHDMELAAEWADDVAVLHEGKVVRHGSPAAVLSDRDLMASAHLRLPRLFALGLLLQEHGIIEKGTALPRDLQALAKMLTEAASAATMCTTSRQ